MTATAEPQRPYSNVGRCYPNPQLSAPFVVVPHLKVIGKLFPPPRGGALSLGSRSPNWALLEKTNFLICPQQRKRRYLSRSGDSQAAESAPKTESGKPLRVNKRPSRQTRTVNKRPRTKKRGKKESKEKFDWLALCKLDREGNSLFSRNRCSFIQEQRSSSN